MTRTQFLKAIKASNPGMTVRWIPDTREYRVAFHWSLVNGRDTEASAYYTNDRDDAATTARAMWDARFPHAGKP